MSLTHRIVGGSVFVLAALTLATGPVAAQERGVTIAARDGGISALEGVNETSREEDRLTPDPLPLAETGPVGPRAEQGSCAPGAACRRSPKMSGVLIWSETIVLVEGVRGLVSRDWYVNPDIGAHVAQAIQRKGQLSGRTWLQSSAPIQNLALDKPAARLQTLSFVDKGEALSFWAPGDMEYSYLFEGPFGLRAHGTVTSGKSSATDHLVRVPLPIRDPTDWASLDTRQRVGRLDITYRNVRPGSTTPAAQGRFSVYLYQLNADLGYRIVGVGY